MEKRTVRRPQRRTEVVSLDEVVTMSDDDLHSRAYWLRGEIERSKSNGGDSVPYEVEFCYLQREKQIRESRIRSHQIYQSRLMEEDRQEFLREAKLPEYRPDTPPRRWWN